MMLTSGHPELVLAESKLRPVDDPILTKASP